MRSTDPQHLLLQPHPATPCPLVRALRVSVAAAPGGALCLRYELAGDLSALRVPALASAPAATDGLWQHSCFEAFIGPADGSAYREFNFSPSGNWAVYAFDDERQRAPEQPLVTATTILTERAGDTLTLNATLPRTALPPAWSDAPVWLGLSAVLETTDGQLSYWALAHPRERPDFHHRAGWTARLTLS